MSDFTNQIIEAAKKKRDAEIRNNIFQQGLKNKPSAPAAKKPLSPSDQTFAGQVVEAAQRKSEAQKKAAGQRIVQNALPGLPDMSTPVDPYRPNYAQLQTPGSVSTDGIMTQFNDKDFTDKVIQRSIVNNLGSGGRHPKAPPVVEQTRDKPAPNPNPDPTIPASGTITGGSRSTPFDIEGFMSNIGDNMGVNLRNPFSSGQLPATADHAAALGMTPGEFETQQNTGGVVQLKSGKYVKTSDLNNDNQGGVKTNGLNLDATGAQVDAFYGTAGNKADALEGQRVLSPKDNYSGGIDDMDPMSDSVGADDSDDGYGPSYTSSISPERMRARAAMLDPNVGTMEGLRRAEGEMGMVVQNGRYATKDADGNVVELTKEGYRRRMNGEEASQEFLDKYRTKVTQAATDTIQETSAGLAPAGVDDNVIYSIDGEELDSPISTAEYNKRFPNDNK